MVSMKNFSRLASGSGRRLALAAITLATTFVVSSAHPAAAQRYEQIDPKITVKESKSLRLKLLDAIRNPGTFQSSGKQNIDAYFKTFFFPMMTQYSAADLARLGNLREDLFKRYLRAAAVPEAQAYLTSVTLATTPVIARRNFHPAVRYNASLILGMLDQKAASGSAMPVPLPAATVQLLELLENDEFDGVKVHPSVKSGALEGLERHVRFGLDPQYTDRVTKAAMAVLEQDHKALDVSRDVNNWMKGQAARVLARQFKAGPTAEVHAALTKLIASDDMGLDDRCRVVGLLKGMAYTSTSDADLTATVLPLGNLTVAVVAEGAEKAKEFENLILGNNPGGGGFGGGFGRGATGSEGPKLERRQLLGRLLEIGRGADALSAGLPEEEKQKLKSLTDLLAPVIKTSRSTRSLDLDVAGEVRQLEGTVDNLVATWQPAAPAEPAALDNVEEPAAPAAAEPAVTDAALTQ